MKLHKHSMAGTAFTFSTTSTGHPSVCLKRKKLNTLVSELKGFLERQEEVHQKNEGRQLFGKDSGEDPYQNEFVRKRLYPEVPKSKYICFYPMDKRRQGDDNWYMLDMEKRRELMRSHGMIGRSYAGKVRQFITGSIGLDEYEWGVTLFSDDMLQFKKLIYEMRFDEVSARYGDFGDFFVGVHLPHQAVPAIPVTSFRTVCRFPQ